MRIQTQIEDKIRAGLSPSYLEVLNESAGHNVPKGSESHFKVVVVADSFQGATLVERHRKVYGLLQEEMNGGVHALAMHTYTPAEWSARTGAQKSPACLGGSKHDAKG